MPYQSIKLILFIIFVLVLTACGQTAVPTATPLPLPTATLEPTSTPEPTAAPDITADFLPVTNETGRFSLKYPADWAIHNDEELGDLELGTKEEIIGETYLSEGASLVVVELTKDVLPMLAPQAIDPSDPIAILNAFINLLQVEVSDRKNSTFQVNGRPRFDNINGHISATAVADVTIDGQPSIFLFSTVTEGDHLVYVLGVSPKAEETEYRPLLEAIVQSIELRP